MGLDVLTAMLVRNERIGAVEAEGRANGRYRALENELHDTLKRIKHEAARQDVCQGVKPWLIHR